LLAACGSALSSGGGSGQSFVDPGPGSGSGPNPNPLAVQLEFTAHNEAAVARTETILASVPFPYGGYPDLAQVSVAGHATAWHVMQRWPDGTVRVAQAQFVDTLPAGVERTYQVVRGIASVAGPFAQQPLVAAASNLVIGAEVQDTFGTAYRAYTAGPVDTLRESQFVRVTRARRFHVPVAAPGIGRDYLSSTFYLTEFHDVPVMLVDWVIGNDYLGGDGVAAGNPDPNLHPLGTIDVSAARFLVAGITAATPYMAVQDQVGGAVLQPDGLFRFDVMQNTFLDDGQTRHYRFVLYFEDPGAPQATRDALHATADAMVASPLFPLATQQTWQDTGGAGLLGGPLPGPVDAHARAEGEYQSWLGSPWFGTWGARGDAQATGTTGTPRNHPLSPELAHAIQGDHHRLLQMLEQKAWAQAMRPYHLYGLVVGDDQDILLWDGIPVYPGSRDLSHESLGRRALWAADPYPAYRSMTQTGSARAHGWEHFDEEHWSNDLLFDYWTISDDEWAHEELRQLGQSLKGLMRVSNYTTAFIQAVRAEGWTMQGFAQICLATGDANLQAYALRRVHERIDPQRKSSHPSRALNFQSNYPGTGWPMPHDFYMPWQHGALFYGYLGAYKHFRDPLLMHICEDCLQCVDYAWVRNYNDAHLGFVPEGLRYYVVVRYNGQDVGPDFFDGAYGVHWGDSPLGGAHTFLIGGLYTMVDWSSNPDVRARAFHYAGLLWPVVNDSSRWDKWNYCVPVRFTQ
jgi:hypothetical protein